MTPDQHARIKDVFQQVCRLPIAERTDVLRRICDADQELFAAVQQLLLHDTEDSYSNGGSTVPVQRIDAVASGEPDLQILPELAPGSIVAHRYRTVSLLGRGGMGDVYRADDLVLNQPVALKLLPASQARNPAWHGRLKHEVQIARAITHPNVCRVHDFIETETDCFVTMAFVDGENLRTLLKQIGRFPAAKALEIARQLCAGLAAAHARGIVHRDIKPPNVMLDARGRAIIMDFGLAALVREIRTGEIRAGTMGYMAPEQMAGVEVTMRSDIYSLGLVLYEVFTGQPAVRFLTSKGKIDTVSRPRPSSLVPDIDPAAEGAILQCLEADPQQRPPSALAVYAALPGGDLVSAALAAGLVPAPKAVASLGGTRHIPSRIAIASLAAFVVMLGLVILLSPRVHPLARAHFDKSPAVMAARASELLTQISADLPVTHEVWGLSERPDCNFLKLSGQNASLHYAVSAETPLVFWTRTGSEDLVPAGIENVVFGAAQITPSDPPLAEAGMTSVTLDAQGRLLGLGVVPRPLESPSVEPDWSRIFTSAGLDLATLTPTEPITVPRIEADRRLAWVGSHPDDPRKPIRVEAATGDGQLVSFAVLRAAPDVPADWLANLLRRVQFLKDMRTVLVGLLVIASIPLVRRNIRLGHSDTRGAFRLAGFVFGARLLAWALQADHVPALRVEAGMLNAALAGALTEAAVVWLFYTALEPLLRRFWPQTLTSWTRLMTGGFRDPLVGSSLLLGAVLGASWALLIQLDFLLTPWLGFNPRQTLRPDDFFSAVMSARQAAAFYVDFLPKVLYESLLLLLLLVLLRASLKRALLVNLVGGIVIALLFVPRGTHPVTSWILIGLCAVAPALYVLTSYGLLPVAAAFFVAAVLLRFPLTLDRHAWYADYSLFALLITASVATWGFAAARGRKAAPA
jgi:hypothetical protein